MTVEFDYTNLSAIIETSLLQTNDQLNNTIRACQQMHVPSDFSQAAFLNSLGGDLENIRNSVLNIRDWLIKSNTIYQQVLDQGNTKVANINNSIISKNDSMVR
ncbi:MAG: hypothetical protein RR047_03245 [Bacilli bacterium]